jgi:hypothetical protein
MSRQVPAELILRNRNGTERAFTLTRCGPGHLAMIEALQEHVLRTMPRGLFVPATRDELIESLETDYCLGAFSEGKLAMFSLMITNRPTERNLGHALGRTGVRLKESVTYDSTFVLPEYRGYGLQRLAHPFKDAEALRLGAKEALATVSPDNSHSLRNMLSSGFSIRARRELYGGQDRYILGKHLQRKE